MTFLKELKIENLSHTTGTKVLFNHINFSILNEQKVGLIGRNGNGKSTFLKVIAGVLDPDEGVLNKPGNYEIGYLSQEHDLDNEKDVLESVFAGDTLVMRAVRTYEQMIM